MRLHFERWVNDKGIHRVQKTQIRVLVISIQVSGNRSSDWKRIVCKAAMVVLCGFLVIFVVAFLQIDTVAHPLVVTRVAQTYNLLL